tara:strand:+ start:93 stop:248 length:156 start_codon:yes stop_codon:yes gene_type:complete
MSYLQILWASQHDWYLTARGGKVLVRDYTTDGELTTRWFSDFSKLKMWAGY